MLLELSTQDVSRLAIWSGVLIGALIVGMVVVSKVKRRLQQPDEPVSAGFTLSDLRRLHKSGQMTDEESSAPRKRSWKPRGVPPSGRKPLAILQIGPPGVTGRRRILDDRAYLGFSLCHWRG